MQFTKWTTPPTEEKHGNSHKITSVATHTSNYRSFLAERAEVVMNCDANQQLREGRQLLFELPRKLAQYLERKIIAKRGWLESSGVWSIVYLPWSNSSAQVKIRKNSAKIWRRRGEASCGLSQGAKAAAWVRLDWCRTLAWPCKRGLLSRTIVDFLTHACFGKVWRHWSWLRRC